MFWTSNHSTEDQNTQEVQIYNTLSRHFQHRYLLQSNKQTDSERSAVTVQNCWRYQQAKSLSTSPITQIIPLVLAHLVYWQSASDQTTADPPTPHPCVHTIAFVSACPVRCTSPHRLAASVHMAVLEISLWATTVVSSSRASTVLRFSICKSDNGWDLYAHTSPTR